MGVHGRIFMDSISAVSVPAAHMMRIDREADVTEWLPVCDGESAVALMSVQWDQEPVGADDVGQWRPYADLCGLRVTNAHGSDDLLTRGEAIALLGASVISAIEAEQSDELYRDHFE